MHFRTIRFSCIPYQIGFIERVKSSFKIICKNIWQFRRNYWRDFYIFSAIWYYFKSVLLKKNRFSQKIKHLKCLNYSKKKSNGIAICSREKKGHKYGYLAYYLGQADRSPKLVGCQMLIFLSLSIAFVFKTVIWSTCK